MQGNKINIQSTDEELMLAVQKESMTAFEILYDRYHQRLFHFILRFLRERALAEDILQEAFLRLFKGRKNIELVFVFQLTCSPLGVTSAWMP